MSDFLDAVSADDHCEVTVKVYPAAGVQLVPEREAQLEERLQAMRLVAEWAVGYIKRVGGYMAPPELCTLRIAESHLVSERHAMESDIRNAVASGQGCVHAPDDGGKGAAP